MSELAGQKEIIEERPRRYGIIYISPEILLDLMKSSSSGRVFRCIKGLPEDVRIVRAGYDQNSANFAVVVEHSSFEELHFGELIPEIESPTFTSFDVYTSPLI